MTTKLICSSLVLSFCFAIALELGLFHFAFASQAEKAPAAKISKDAQTPIVFARYPKTDSLLISQAPEEIMLCRASEAYQSSDLPSALITHTDLCAPKPSLAIAKDAPKESPKWSLQKSPAEFIWQQEVPSTSRLVVELIDSDGLPWPSRFEASQRATTQSIKIIPSYELSQDRDMFLVANLYNADDKRVENWVLPISVQKGTSDSMPWMTKK